MRLFPLPLLIVAFAGWLGAAEPPDAKPFAPFPPMPAPVQPAGAPVKLTGKQTFVSSQAIPFVLRAYPASAVAIRKIEIKEGETHHFEKEFSDGTGEKSFKGPLTLYFVSPAGKGGAVDLVATPLGLKTEADIKTVQLDVDAGQGPQPPPDPPKPNPKPEPVTPSKLYLLVIEETEQATANRGAFFSDKALSAQIDAKAHTWRVVDKDVKNSLGQVPPDLVPYMERIKGKALPQLFLVTPSGQIRYAGDMPATPAALLTELTKAGG